MKIIEDYLKKDLNRDDLNTWQDIRVAYAERAVTLVKNDWQSPSYLSSLDNQAGRRDGKIIGNINDYTRDQHDLSLAYEKKFVSEYLPRIGLLPLEAFVTSSGMAALTTAIVMIHRLHLPNNTVLVGKHCYFQNLELLSKSFSRVVMFDEENEREWQNLVVRERPIAVFVDTMCNVASLVVPPVLEIAEYLRKNIKNRTYLVVDNSMLSIGFPFKKLFRHRNRKLEIVGWESLNKYYQFGLDRVTGGVVWGRSAIALELFHARMHAGTIMGDMQVAMLPTPSYKYLKLYLERIEQNRTLLLTQLTGRGHEAKTNYDFGGAQVVVGFKRKLSYGALQRIIAKMIRIAKKEGVQISAGTSFGFPTTRVYLTARQTKFTEMFLRISVGVEEREAMEKVASIIGSVIAT